MSQTAQTQPDQPVNIDQLYRRIKPRMRSYISSRFFRDVRQDDGMADDVVHNVFVALLEAIRKNTFSYDDIRALDSWLMQVTRREIIEHYRKSFGRSEPGRTGSRRKTVQIEDMGFEDRTQDPTILNESPRHYRMSPEWVETLVELQEVLAAIDKLNPRAREALLHPEDSLEEIAERLGTTAATINTDKSRARTDLRKRFREV